MKASVIFGDSNPHLAKAIWSQITPWDAGRIVYSGFRRFQSGEIYIDLQNSVRGTDVYIVQGTNAPANDNLMELMFLIDAARRSSANSITAVIPHFGYARQDRQLSPRSCIAGRVVADMLESAGACRIIAMDIHATQLQGFFSIPFTNLTAAGLFVDYLKDVEGPDGSDSMVVVSPDVGGVARARNFAERLQAEVALVEKRRDAEGNPAAYNVIGAVEGRHCVLYDDMIDSGGTIAEAAKVLLKAGALSVQAFATHGIFSNGIWDRLREAGVAKVVTTNTIYPRVDDDDVCTRGFGSPWQVDVGGLFAEAIKRVHAGESLRTLL